MDSCNHENHVLSAELWPNDVLQYGASSVGHLEFKNFNFSNWILVITIVYLT